MSITLEYNFKNAAAAIAAILQRTDNVQPLYNDIGEYLLIAHDRRFDKQQAPDGTPWRALSPRYLRRKKKNKNKILQLDGYLKNLLRYQSTDNQLLFGSDRVYARIHHLGGQIKREARESDVYFRQNKDGSVGNRFVKPKQSNFAQRVKIGAYTINMPARPWLGTSAQDDNEILAITNRYLESVINAA